MVGEISILTRTQEVVSVKRYAPRLALALSLLAISIPASTQPSLTIDLADKNQELQKLESEANESRERKRALEGELAGLYGSREELNRELIDASNKLRGMETRATDIEQRLDTLWESESKITKSLEARRAVIAEILVALQRMGRHPPPALLTRPQDILEALRASMMLESILPPIRTEARALQKDLTDLLHLRENMQTEKARLDDEKALLKTQSLRVAKLIAERQETLAHTQTQLKEEVDRAQSLAQRAISLKDLIAHMENNSDAARRGALAARESDASQAMLNDEQRRRALAAPFKDLSRLAPAVGFAQLKGRLNYPVAGSIAKRFGTPDGNGGKEKGLSLETRPNGVVTAPSDGWVAFSGPYRGYGQLLIINAGDGYYVVLAGMSRLNVNVGQFVLAGEPVASMGDGVAKTAATIAIGASTPILYVEFRKDGTSIDPGPWWAKSDSRKVGG